MSKEKQQLKIRLALLGKKQCEMIPKIQEKLPEYSISQCDVANAFGGQFNTEKLEAIRLAADEVLNEWEAERGA